MVRPRRPPCAGSTRGRRMREHATSPRRARSDPSGSSPTSAENRADDSRAAVPARPTAKSAARVERRGWSCPRSHVTSRRVVDEIATTRAPDRRVEGSASATSGRTAAAKAASPAARPSRERSACGRRAASGRHRRGRWRRPAARPRARRGPASGSAGATTPESACTSVEVNGGPKRAMPSSSAVATASATAISAMVSTLACPRSRMPPRCGRR